MAWDAITDLSYALVHDEVDELREAQEAAAADDEARPLTAEEEELVQHAADIKILYICSQFANMGLVGVFSYFMA